MAKRIKRISCVLSEKSIDGVIAQLNAYQNDIDKKTDELCRRIAEIGANVAQRYFNSSPDGRVIVSVKKIDNGYMLCADGHDVAFLEFGAGDYTAGYAQPQHPFTDNVSFEVRPGSWSEEDKMAYSLRGHWYYGGQNFEGIVPTYAMANASAEMIYRIIDEAKKVFE